MDREVILKNVEEICKDIFDFEDLKINTTTEPSDISQWDSLNHLNLISSIEEDFSIKFNFEEISSVKNIGDIINLILNKI
jgi:acyl carrier protein